MLKKLFISAILLVAVLSFVVSLLKGNNGEGGVVKLESTVAVINITGPIISGQAEDSLLGSSGEGTTSGEVMEQIREAAEDSSVKALLLRIDSPGGSVTAAEEIGRELARFKEKTDKPIVASMGDTAASAGYWLAACQSNKIYANASTLTGSIGVYMPYMNLEELYQKLGLRPDKIKSGVHKDIMSSDRPMTAEERSILQNMVNQMYNQFVATIAKGRNMDEGKVRQLADGRVYTGAQAKDLGLVDEIGNYYDALAATGQLAGLGDKPKIKENDHKLRLSTLLSAGLEQSLRLQAAKLLRQGALEQAVPQVKG